MGPSDKKSLIDKLLKKSLLNENMNRAKEGRPLIPKRKQDPANDLKLCSGCNGFFRSRLIGRHFASCPQADVRGNPTAVPPSVMELPDTGSIKKAPDLENFRTDVLSKFRMDGPGEICRTDKDLISVGYKIWRGKRDHKRPMQVMRSLARIIHEMRKSTGNEHLGLMNILNKKMFHELEFAIDTLCRKDDNTLKHGSRVNFGHFLRDAATNLNGICFINDDLEAVESLEGFLRVLRSEWSYLFNESLKQIECNRFEKTIRPAQLPNKDDMLALRKHIENEVKLLTEMCEDFTFWDRKVFSRARSVVVARLTLFNARRGDEAAKLQLSQFEDAIKDVWINSEDLEKVNDPMESFLKESYKLAYVRNKGGEEVCPNPHPHELLNYLEEDEA